MFTRTFLTRIIRVATKRRSRFGGGRMRIGLFAFSLIVIGHLGCSGGAWPGKKADDDDQGTGSSGGTGRYLSEYDWQRIEQVRLPSLAADKVSSGLALTGVARCLSSTAESFKQSFADLSGQVLKVPQVKLCNGHDIELGVTYRERWAVAGTPDNLFRFEEREEHGIVHAYCAANGDLKNLTTYKFGDDDSFKTEFFSRSNFRGESATHSIFDKGLTNAGEIVTRHVNVFWAEANAFSAKYNADGTGSSNYHHWTAGEQEVRGVLFSDLGGGSLVKTNSSADGEKQWREFFDAQSWKVSSLELDQLDFAPIESLALPTSKEDALFAVTTGIDGIDCRENVVEVECVEQGAPASDQATDDGGQATCDPDSAPNHSQWDVVVKDQWDRNDFYVTIDASLGRDGSTLDPQVGDIFGFKASLEKGDGSILNLDDRLELDLSDVGGVVESYTPTGCEAVDDTPVAGGTVTTEEDACRLAREYPALVKVIKAGSTSIPMRIDAHTATFQFETR